MRIATWNVNSIRARVERVVDYLVREEIDVLCMQEIKCRDNQFPYEQFTAAGYDVVLHGLNQWNGVAIASRLPLEDVKITFPSQPGFGEPDADGNAPIEARAIAATVDGVRLWSLYVPNGRELDHPHYAYKLEWLQGLARDTAGWLAESPDMPLALLGDWNVVPYDDDVWDIREFAGSTHVSAPEREAFFAFEAVGLKDVVRPLIPEGYTYWDYKQLRFPRNEGMRIDFIMGSPAFAELVDSAVIARDERKGDGPSDHVPVVVDLLRDGLTSLALLARLPKRVDSLITRAELGQLTLRNPELEKRTSTLSRAVRRVVSAVLFGVLFIGGLIVVERDTTLGTVLIITSAIPLLHALFADVVARRGPLP